jgi:20S proteasome subunit beta 2
VYEYNQSPSISSLRRSRARIIQDDVAYLQDPDLDLFNDRTAEAILEEAHETFSPYPHVSHPEPEATTTHERLQLALSPDQDSSESFKAIPSNTKFRSTGTTIVGCLVEQGAYVILGADTRATDDRMVADKRCEKIHCISTNVFCCGAGTSADLEALTRYAQYSMALKALHESSIGTSTAHTHALEQKGGIILQPIGVSAACRFLRDALYDAGGSLGVNLILGGYDVQSKTGRLTAIHPHGSMDVVPFAALGSGGLAAMAVLESRYHPELTREEGIELVKSAVLAGIENDLGSGSQVDLCVLGPEGAVEYTRAVVPEQQLETDEEDRGDEFTSEEKESSGVNGFGNLPFAVNSHRMVASQHDESMRLEKWDALLGFK